jgi:antitoxin ParD1/3/4
MATMNISLPDRMKEWVESRSEDGRYANSSDYVRDLIRRDQERAGQDHRGHQQRHQSAFHLGNLRYGAG